jgi:hypothetical protein
MLLPPDTCDDDCVMPGYRHRAARGSESVPTLAFHSIPFLLTFLGAAILVLYKLFPLVSGLPSSNDGEDHYLPSHAPPSLRQKHAEHGSRPTRRRGIVALSFSTTIALSAVLAELILCEISNSLDPAARALALRFTVPTLLFLLIVLIPFLELQSIISGSGWSLRRTEGRIPKTAWLLQGLGFAAWLAGFWWLGQGIPGTYIHSVVAQEGKGLSEACLERVGIIGVSLMALLSGFAAVSALWQTFIARTRKITETDVARKQAGLDATYDMLEAKRSRLRALQHKMQESPAEGFMTKVMGTIRGGGDAQEIKALQLEVSGLDAMALSLSGSVSLLQSRLASQRRAASPLGRVCLVPVSYGFAIYCGYRIITAALATLRRRLAPSSAAVAVDSDPITRALSLIASTVHPSLDRRAWGRQISFALSGIILLAAFNSVLQTFHMLSRLSPSVVRQARANLALVVAQVSATYVISSALLLRGNLPVEMRSAVSEALGSPLEPGFVEGWFEGWFLAASAATAVGIWAGRSLSRDGDLDDLDGDVEMGQKRS